MRRPKNRIVYDMDGPYIDRKSTGKKIPLRVGGATNPGPSEGDRGEKPTDKVWLDEITIETINVSNLERAEDSQVAVQ